MKKKLNFEQAYKRLNEIYDIFNNQEILDVDKIINLQNEAKELYDFCNKDLKKVEKLDK